MSGDRVRYTVDFHMHVDAERNTVDVLKELKPSKRQECMRQWMTLGRAVEQLLAEQTVRASDTEVQRINHIQTLMQAGGFK